jgi:hypothetical protein
MRFMLLLKGDVPAITGATPNSELINAMLSFSEELTRAGVLITAEGFHPSSAAARIVVSKGQRTLVNGPFTPLLEQVAGFFLINASSAEEANDWARRCPVELGPGPDDEDAIIEVRQLVDTQQELPALSDQGRMRDLQIRRTLPVA